MPLPLRETYEQQGAFLFRWRSYLPLVGIPVVLVALLDLVYSPQTLPAPWERLWEIFCILLSFLGLVVRSLVAGYVPHGTSGRNTLGQAADTLNTKGMYSVVRNPLYFGNFLMVAGIILFMQVWWFVFLATFAFWYYYERMVFAEEEFLRKKFGETYLTWANRTPIFFPNFKLWQKAPLPFSWKTALRREYSSCFGMMTAFAVLGTIIDFLVERHDGIHVFWLFFFVCWLLFFLTARFLKKKTRWLDIEGRV